MLAFYDPRDDYFDFPLGVHRSSKSLKNLCNIWTSGLILIGRKVMLNSIYLTSTQPYRNRFTFFRSRVFDTK